MEEKGVETKNKQKEKYDWESEIEVMWVNEWMRATFKNSLINTGYDSLLKIKDIPAESLPIILSKSSFDLLFSWFEWVDGGVNDTPFLCGVFHRSW